ncbi:MAG: DEAD/DEAH box helicase [Bacillota bacterium]
MSIPVPSYLKDPETMGRYYGVLRYEGKSQSWVIEGEPCVIEMAKRLFPGSSGKGSGEARFKNNKRSVGDLNWLMHRYPLEISEPERWGKTIDDAIHYVLVREEINRSPQAITPPPAHFKGTLRKFQEEGLAFLLHNRRTLLADEMGLGKTVVALAFLAATSSYPVLLIVPPHLIINWTKEIGRFLVTPKLPGQTSIFDEANMIHVIKGLKPYDLPPANIYLIHYLLLRGWKSYLPGFGFKTVIFDEIQELRHKLTEKYSSASLVAQNSDNVIGLSGTPIYNKGGEIWNVLNILEYHCLGDWDSFTREWCHGYGSDVIVKPDLLGDYLKREGLLIRRTKAAVLKELPPKRRVVQSIDFDAGVYSSLIQQAVKKASTLDYIEDIFEKGRATREIVNETRQTTGIAKASYVAAFVKMLLEAKERVLLFAYHHAVFDVYMDELKDYDPKKITGKETAKEKDAAVETFKAGKTPLVIISLRAAAGIDGLQSATSVVFGELDWSPAIHSQAEDRAHRMGQQDSILCYYLVCDEGSDEDIQEALGLKVSQFVGLMGDKGETEEDRLLSQVAAKDHMNGIVEKLKKRGQTTRGGTDIEKRKHADEIPDIRRAANE